MAFSRARVLEKVLFHSARGGQAALFVMHFEPRRFHLGDFSLPPGSPVIAHERERDCLFLYLTRMRGRERGKKRVELFAECSRTWGRVYVVRSDMVAAG